ncbi:MAG: hypothetical protein ABI840_06745 [bacterium]
MYYCISIFCDYKFFCSKHKPYSPTIKDFDFKFEIPDSSNIKINIYSYDGKDGILKIDTNISRGCYYLNWVSQNVNQMKSGMYFAWFEAYEYKREGYIFKEKLNIPLIK